MLAATRPAASRRGRSSSRDGSAPRGARRHLAWFVCPNSRSSFDDLERAVAVAADVGVHHQVRTVLGDLLDLVGVAPGADQTPLLCADLSRRLCSWFHSLHGSSPYSHRFSLSLHSIGTSIAHSCRCGTTLPRYLWRISSLPMPIRPSALRASMPSSPSGPNQQSISGRTSSTRTWKRLRPRSS